MAKNKQGANKVTQATSAATIEAAEPIAPPQVIPLTHEDDPFLTPAEVGRQLGMSAQTIGRWIQDGLIIATFFPNDRWKVRKSEVNRLLRGSSINKQVV